MYRSRPKTTLSARLIAGLVLSPALALWGWTAGTASATAPAVPAIGEVCLTNDDPYWNGCRAGVNAGWAVGGKCQPKPPQSYGDPWNRYRHGYVDGFNSAYEEARKDAKCAPTTQPTDRVPPVPRPPAPQPTDRVPPVPQRPPAPPPPAEPRVNPEKEKQRAEAEKDCSAVIPYTTKPEDRARIMQGCMADKGFDDYTGPAPAKPDDAQKRAKAVTDCSAAIPYTTKPEDRARIMQKCMADKGYDDYTEPGAPVPPPADTTPDEPGTPPEEPVTPSDPQ
ncbi:hypothetical protein [Streptomyces venezuelae]|nr:hypothetical protein [Streptomyces venezuelae]